MRRISLSLALLLSALAGFAPAQDRPGSKPGQAKSGDDSPETSQEFVLTTQFLEAIQTEKWNEAIKVYGELRSGYPHVVEQNRRLQFLHARAQYALKQNQAAAENLESLLERQENHIEGLYLLAQIRAQSKDEQDKERAQDLLIQSARAGQFVLRDISSPDGQKVFGYLLKKPEFILRVMKASNEYQLVTTGLRNPFKSPLKKATKGEDKTQPGRVVDEARLRELEDRIEELFRQIVQLAQEKQVEELVTKFTELRQIMNEFGQAGTDEVKKKLEKWNQKLQDLGEVRLSIKLQVYINEGNQHLRAMADGIRDENYDLALERFTRIEEIVADMRAEEREVFHRNADALFLRGQALADKAKRMKRIAEFKLPVTGIVVAPEDTDERNSAIIDDRIYYEGDGLLEPGTDAEIDGLRVIKISRSTVTFRFEDTEFVRELKALGP